ncbi:MAG TPA: recombinase family protein [Ktedonobacterales bacterium]|jgi:predicted site-specific integrase-resolvase
MKLAEYAKQMGVRYETAWRWYRDGKIKGRRVGKHTIIITEDQEAAPSARSEQVVVYARVSSAENKPNLDAQAERLVAYCAAKGYQVSKVVKEIGSGVNDARPKLLSLLEDHTITLIVVERSSDIVEHSVCFQLLQTALSASHRAIECLILSEEA